MPQSLKIFCLFVLVSLMCLAQAAPVQAIPPLPSSFYGTVKVNGQNVPDGTLVRALIDGQAYASAYTQTYQGDSVYSLDVAGDDSGSVEVEGGLDQDVIQFEVGGLSANQTGTWASGTNVALDLTVASTTPLATAQATPTKVFTQTPVALENIEPTHTATATGKPASENQPPPAATATQPPAQAATATLAPQATESAAGGEATTAAASHETPTAAAQAAAQVQSAAAVDEPTRLPPTAATQAPAKDAQNALSAWEIVKRVIGVLLIAVVVYVVLLRRKQI